MTRRRPEPIEEPEKPFEQMTDDEKRADLTRDLRKVRDGEVRRGRRPRSMRETRLWLEGHEAREQQTAARVARAERKQRPGTRPGPERPEEQVLVSDATPGEIAQWMADRLEQQDSSLYQADAVDEIAKRFGEQFTYLNDNGNPAIDKRVLRAFKTITGDTVVWERWDFCWRKRTERDAPGRKQE